MECNSKMNQFNNVTLAQDSASCTSLACRKNCHHLVWVLHNVFYFPKDEPLINFKKKPFTQAEWQKITNSLPFPQLQKVTNQTFQVNVCKTTKEAKCAICKKTTSPGDLQHMAIDC